MKRSRKTLFFIIIVLIILFSGGCSNEEELVQKNHIEKFITNKADLYNRKDEIISSLDSLEVISVEEDTSDINSGEADLDGVLEDIKILLAEKEYERLAFNRYLIDKELLTGTYDKAEIKNLEYEKVSGDEKQSIYEVRYTENLYFENTFKEEKNHTSEFTLENKDGKWLISHIN